MHRIGTFHIIELIFFAFASGKTYERCELARELNDRFEVPKDEVATWVCIAEHESQYNTSAVGMVNGDYSNDHGIFQINDEFWCSPPGKGYACGLTCAELEDDDIADDFACVRKIFDEHKILSGDGFNAWAVYKPYCKSSKVSKYIDGCFNSTTDAPHQKKKVPTKKVYPWLVPRPSSTPPAQEPASKSSEKSDTGESSGTTTVPARSTETEQNIRRLGNFPSSFGTPFSITSTRASPIIDRVIPESKSTAIRVKGFQNFGNAPTEHPRFATSSSTIPRFPTSSSTTPRFATSSYTTSRFATSSYTTPRFPTSSSTTPRVGTIASHRSTSPTPKPLPVTSVPGTFFSRPSFPSSFPAGSANRLTKPSTSKIDLFDEASPTLDRGIPIEHYQQRVSSFRINGRVWL